jgi:hypothetical protein
MELQPIQSKIYEIRGQRVMLDFDLAELYQVETRTLKQAVRRNIERFEGDDFMFELSDNEYNALKDRIRSQNCDLRNRRTRQVSQISALCLYGNGRRNAFERVAQ